MSMLAELVEVVIGVDTHSQTHTAAVIDVRTGRPGAVAVRAALDAPAGRRRPGGRRALGPWPEPARRASICRARGPRAGDADDRTGRALRDPLR